MTDEVRTGTPKVVRTTTRTKSVDVPLIDGVTVTGSWAGRDRSIFVDTVHILWVTEASSDRDYGRERLTVEASGVLSRSNGTPRSILTTMSWPDSEESPWPDWLRRLVNEHRPAWVPTGGESNG